jgi:multiple sugar transport system permease protein
MTDRLKLKGTDSWWIFLLLVPTVVGVVFGTVGSLAASVAISFTDWNNVQPPQWVGWSNYLSSLTDPKFGESLLNTLKFSGLYVPGSILTALAAALILNSQARGRGFFRAAFFFPSLTSSVAVALMFSWIYSQDNGILNQVLTAFGAPPVNWMGKENILFSVTIANVWGAVGEGMIVFLAALQAVPAVYYEAARIEGAGRWGLFRHITLPFITPALFFQVVIVTVNALQAFEYIYMLTRRTQGESTMATVVYLIYRNGFRWFNMGLASAQAVLLAGVIIVFMALYFKAEKELVVYDK